MKISQTKDIRSANRLTIIKYIQDHRQTSRARISEETGLNKATVSTIVKEWMSMNLVRETTMGDSSGGRPPINLTLCARAGFCIAVDIGVRQVGLLLTDLNNDIISRSSFSIEAPDFSHVYRQLYTSLDRLIQEIPASSYGLIGISLSVRGIIDLDGIIRFIPKLKWHNIDLKSLFEQRYQVPVFIDNDGNLAASMEYRLHPQYRELTVLSITDVISCGMITNGQLIRGYLGFANAVGHHTINMEETRQCSCGKYGCWEQYSSEQCLIDEMNLRLETPISDIDSFIRLVKEQNSDALEILDRYIENLAIGLSNIIFFINCEMIILNSRLIQSLPYLLPEIIKRTILPITHGQEILISTLGKEAPILGASRKAIEEFFETLSTRL